MGKTLQTICLIASDYDERPGRGAAGNGKGKEREKGKSKGKEKVEGEEDLSMVPVG